MIDHPTAEQLAGYVLQTITDEEREHIDKHLGRCLPCRAGLSKHETTLRRIRNELAGDLRQVGPSNRSAFAQVAPEILRSRRWSTLKARAGQSLAVGPRAALWMAVASILVLILLNGPLKPTPVLPDPATAALFENRDLRVYTGQPALSVGPKGAWDSRWVNPGAVVFHDGQFHMFYSGKSLSDENLSIGYATSADGLTWTRGSPNPVITLKSLVWMPEVLSVTVNSVVVEEGRWTLYFTASDINARLKGKIGQATANSPFGPWVVQPQPALTPGQQGEWDELAVGDACVSATGDGYAMYYVGGVFRPMIGRAVSPDGLTWTKYNDAATTDKAFAASDPVLQGTEDWEGGSVEYPCVQQQAGLWKMTYNATTTGAVGYAVSIDGIHWRKSPQNPILQADLSGEQRMVKGATFFIHDQTAYLYFQPDLNESDGRGIYVATWREP